MTVELYGVRRGASIQSISAADTTQMELLPAGRIIKVTLDLEPPKKLERFYRGLCHKVAEATGSWPDGAAVHTTLMLRAHRLDWFSMTSAGMVLKVVPQSTVGWGAAEWRTHIEWSLLFLVTEVFPGLTSSYLRRQVEEFVGIKMRDALEDLT